MKYLKAHIESVHEGIRHKCKLCPKVFTQSFYLGAHHKRCHVGYVHKRMKKAFKIRSKISVQTTHKEVKQNENNETDLSEYEKIRLQNIADRQKKFKELNFNNNKLEDK